MTATLLIGTSVLDIEIRNADLHRGRIMAQGIDGTGAVSIYRFTKRQDGTYRLKGMKDGILMMKVSA